ncbi:MULTISPECIES: hypothetical protein [Hansschlegelia]|uniref:CopL family metal-binding regulatory protein n=1 Tax=Hansschlegelia zhihuaiae TaxID=405005 RepID=A0A4Q0MF34_9HYPH|nr:hypothetical protein [Hansschlegelia zhihuaiae]RXF71496.1 hypothetical protein EK403_15640 [Hansschlegelia zhihuaiae]
MSPQTLLRLLAGLVLAMTLFVGWTTPSQAHGGHDAAMASQPHQEPVKAASFAAQDVAQGDHQAPPTVSAAEPDCAGHASAPDGSSKTCCSNTCHAVLASDLALPAALSVVLAVVSSATEPSELQGPTIFIKRPPRRLAALVG